MKSNGIVREWLKKANDDLLSAQKLMRGKERIAWSACFHAHQAAEKSLKAYIIFRGNDPERIHHLVELLKQCRPFDSSFEDLKPLADYLNPFSVRTRPSGRVEHHRAGGTTGDRGGAPNRFICA